MGLGKTLQAISLMSYLKIQKLSPGPFCESGRLLLETCWIFCCGLLLVLRLYLLIVIQMSAVVLCPLSVTDGWVSEIDRFAPKLRVLRYVGDKEHRRTLRQKMYEQVKEQSSRNDVSSNIVTCEIFNNLLIFFFFNCICSQVSLLPFDVLLTTYDIALMDQDFLSQIPWHYAVIDEAQRLKNPTSVC